EATAAGEFLDVPEVGPALWSPVRELVLAVHQIGAERIAGDAVVAHHVRRQLIGLGGVPVDLLEQSLEHGLAVFHVAELDPVPLETPGVTWGFDFGKRDAGHGLDLDSGLCRERLEEGLPPRGFPYAAVGIHIDRSALRARRADDRGRAEERAGAERQHPTAGYPSGHSPPRFLQRHHRGDALPVDSLAPAAHVTSSAR